MRITRRTVLGTGTAAAALSMLPGKGRAEFAPVPGGWRRFEVVTQVELPRDSRTAQLWLPLPSVSADGWSRPGTPQWTTTATTAEIWTDPTYGAQMLHATWEGSSEPRTLELTMSVESRDRATNFDAPHSPVPLSEAERALNTAPTTLIPTDGLVKETADAIVDGASDDLDKARRIYEWIVVNTQRNPKTRGCGLGDIASMLAMGDLSGKCADLNALYVGLARASGLPARDLYGLRVAPSAFGYKSLGANSPDVTKAQHCRAEVWLENFGWVPVDPADVRKVMLEEPPKDLSLDDPKVAAARHTLFGAWEGNWIAFNSAHDVVLPGATDGQLGFLMYPQAELDGTRLDPLDPAAFVYTNTAREAQA